MFSVTGTYRNGSVVFDEPVYLPEGTRVCVTLEPPPKASDPDDDRLSDGRPWPKTPEEISAFLAEMDAIPPLFSEEEYQRFEAQRLAEKERKKQLAAERTDASSQSLSHLAI